MTVRIVHKNSSASGKNPTAAQLANGELSINYHEDGPFLSVKDTAGNIIRVGGVWISNNSPPDPKKGALWVHPDNNILYVRDDAEWIPIAGGGGNGGGTGDLTAVTEGPGIDVANSAGPIPKVSIDLHAQSGLEIDPAGDSGKLRVNAGTGLQINASGELEATGGGLTYIGVVSCDDDGDLQDADVGDIYACDVTTVNGTNSVTASWYTCITNLASPADVSVGDLLICTTAGGGTPANSRYTRLATGDANQITTINANEGLDATVAGGNTVNLRVDLHTSVNGNDSGLETDPAGNNGELRVRAGAGLDIVDDGGANQGDLVVDTANIPLPNGGDGTGDFGYWNRTEPGGGANDLLQPRAAGDDVFTSGDLRIGNTAAAPRASIDGATGEIRSATLETGDDVTTGTGLVMADNQGDLVRAQPGDGIEINSGQIRVDLEAAGAGTGGLQIDNAEIRVQAGDGIELTANGVAADLLANGGLLLTANDGTGELAIDAANMPAPGNDQSFGYWTRENDDSTLTPRTAGDIVMVDGGTAAAPTLAHTGDLNTGIAFPANDEIELATGGVDRVRITDASTVINEDGNDHDFRVEGDGDTDLLLVDAGTDVVGISETAANIATAHTANDDLKLLVAGDAQVTGDVQSTSQNGGQLAGFRNLIINGLFAINQRDNGGATLANADIFTRDRWETITQGSGNNATVNRSGVNLNNLPNQDGAADALIYETTAALSQGASTSLYLSQKIEGRDFRAVSGWRGNATDRPLTLSFWVRSSKTGIYSISLLRDPTGIGTNDLDTFIADFEVQAASTWEKQVIPIPAPSVFGASITSYVQLCIHVWGGPSRRAGSTGWVNAASDVAVVSPNYDADWGDAAGQTFEVTAVQLEPGPVATPFEQRPNSIELDMCKRFYQRGRAGIKHGAAVSRPSSGEIEMFMNYMFPVSPRAPSGGSVVVSAPSVFSNPKSDTTSSNEIDAYYAGLSLNLAYKCGVSYKSTSNVGTAYGYQFTITIDSEF